MKAESNLRQGGVVERPIAKAIINIFNIKCNKLNQIPTSINTSIVDTGYYWNYLQPDEPHTNCAPPVQIGFTNEAIIQFTKVYKLELPQLLHKLIV